MQMIDILNDKSRTIIFEGERKEQFAQLMESALGNPLIGKNIRAAVRIRGEMERLNKETAATQPTGFGIGRYWYYDKA